MSSSHISGFSWKDMTCKLSGLSSSALKETYLRFCSIFSHPSRPLARSDPVTFFLVSLLLTGAQSCCLLQSSLPAEVQFMLRQSHLACCCCIPSRWPHLNPPQNLYTKDTEKHKRRLTTHTDIHEDEWKACAWAVDGRGASLYFSLFSFFLSLEERKEKMMWGEACLDVI